ncbi:MAG: hypothetical protein V4858_21880 [Pseudomonadota bacterium]
MASCMAGGAIAQTSNLPTGTEGLRGKHWRGSECCGWTWDWVQVNGPTFSGSFSNRNGQRITEGNIIISIIGNQVTITRANGLAAGGCTYTGTIRPTQAEGTYTCAGQPSGRWGATIYQTK